ncbi:helix-turn-helix domain-containing protein [Secundilactobacillus paracollinoides]|uniref:helix-turn-helix domain-containing protein n=1 Tax=Secundilactobacillus paracollinoides TaxID=240427 RepID=UPI0006F035A1|nr:helix-turn-helix transcriptional regulator [Secundilactobacillus paracollinoides]KRL80930.1 hypothetical protein FC17_GL002742 [Secundilactobacillus paracollinoides DSM 15502 = JCM 11969]
MQVGEQLKRARTEKQLTQQTVAETLSVSRQTISSWETGHSYPDIDSLVALSDYYGISLDTLIKEDNDMKAYLKKEDVLKRLSPVTTLLLVIDVLFLIALMFNISALYDRGIMLLMGFINIGALLRLESFISDVKTPEERWTRWTKRRPVLYGLSVVAIALGGVSLWLHWMALDSALILMILPIAIVIYREIRYARYNRQNS